LQAPNWTLVKLAVEPIGMIKPPGGLPIANAVTAGVKTASKAMVTAPIVNKVTRRTAALLRITHEAPFSAGTACDYRDAVWT
jgi:hypothetical protein